VRRRARAPGHIRHHDRWAAALVGAALVGVALVTSACSTSGLTLARQACADVATSIRIYTSAEHDTNVERADSMVTEAAARLEEALPLAAQANSANPAWNPLMTTLQEMGRTSEANLIPALEAQCSAAAHPSTSPGTGRSPTGRTASTGRTATRPS
jgi:hypothetical protein